MKKTSDTLRARQIVDASYAELLDKPRCRLPECSRPFTPKSPTQGYCGGECALIALTRREAQRAMAPDA